MAPFSTLSRLGRVTRQGIAALIERSTRAQNSGRGKNAGARRPAPRKRSFSTPGREYRGDWRGALPATSWQAKDDGRPDPGEVVWAWVPFEEDHSRGKDRPVLVVARHPDSDGVVLALPLTSKDHDRDATQEARAGRHWMDVGSGAWDRGGRPSEARLDRVLQLDVSTVRREGTALDRATFEQVVSAVRALG